MSCRNIILLLTKVDYLKQDNKYYYIDYLYYYILNLEYYTLLKDVFVNKSNFVKYL